MSSDLLKRLRVEINRELPRTHKGFRCQYTQDMVMRALDLAFTRVSCEWCGKGFKPIHGVHLGPAGGRLGSCTASDASEAR
jgi:hypothetical protein